MMKLFEEVNKKKGDGVVLMDPKAELKPGKTEAWKQHKVKNFQLEKNINFLAKCRG